MVTEKDMRVVITELGSKLITDITDAEIRRISNLYLKRTIKF